MANTSTNISLTLPELSDTTKIREDFNDNFNIVDGRFSATYMAVQAAASVAITGGSITGITDLVVSDGGTGVSTFTDGGVLLGSGSGAITAMAVLTDGQMIVGNGTTDPVAESGATLRTSIGAASRALDNIASCAINAALLLGTSDAAALGSASKMWSDLFLASGAVINFNNGDITLTHSANVLTVGGGALALGANNLTMTGSIADTSNRVTKGWFTDLEVTNDIVGDITGNAATATAADAVIFDAKEENTSAIVKGQPVYQSGATGVAKPQIGLADGDDADKSHCIGLAAEAISQNGNGTVQSQGVLEGVDSLGTNVVNPSGQTWVAGDKLYLHTTAGGLTNVKPTIGHIVEIGHSLYGSSNTDAIQLHLSRSRDGIRVATGEDVILRVGDSIGANKVSVVDYTNTEVAHIDSDGNIDGTALTLDTALSATEGGTGVANNAASTITISGNFATTLTVTEATGVTLPASGTLVNSAVASLSSLTTIGTVTSGTLSTGAVLADVTMTLGADADGDIYYRSSNKLTRLAKGTENHYLKQGATNPGWAAISGGYTNLTSFVDQTAFRVFYSDTAGDVTELALGAAGTYLKSNGAAANPTFAVPAGAGDVSKVGTPVDSQVGVWTGDGTIEGAATLTYDGSNLQLTGDIGATGARITKGWFANLETTGDLTVNGTALAAIYSPIAGNASLVTVGTIATGTWEGTDVGIAHGGTGVSTGAMTGLTSILNAALYVGRDTDNQIKFATDNNIIFRTSGADGALFYSTGELDMNAHSIGFTQQTATGDGATTVDWKLGNKMKFTFGAFNETFTFTAPTNPCNILLMMVQDGTGSRTAVWPGTVKWAGGTAPTLTTTAVGIDICSFYYDGTSYHGVASLAFAVPA